MNIRNLNELDNKWNNLKLSEKLFCLAIDSKKVGIQFPVISKLGQILTAAIIFELTELNVVTIIDEKNFSSKSVPVYDRVLDFCLKYVRGNKQTTELKKLFFLLCLKQNEIQRLIRHDLMRKSIVNIKKKSYIVFVKRRYSFHKQFIIQKIVDEILHILSSPQNGNSENLLFISLVAKMKLITDDTIQRNMEVYLKNFPPEQMPQDVKSIIELIHF